ncbi:hypothetical protein D9M72_457450 [compost metagenome]
MRLALRSRWWCTALTSSSDGMGAHWAFESRSESTTYCTPRLMAPDTCSQISVRRARSAFSPPSGRYRPRTFMAILSPSGVSMLAILASWSLLITGNGSETCGCRTCLVSSRLPFGPMAHIRDVTSSSRMASSGGLVTCAKDCTK